METLHPAIVHFAVVLPLVALSFQALYLLKKEEVYSKAALVLMVFTAVFTIAAYLTGANDAKSGVAEILDTYHPEGLHDLKEHADIGFKLLILMFIVALIKVVNFFFTKRKNVEIIFAVVLGLSSVFMLFQAKEGGEIVYEHGALFQTYEIKDTLKESLVDLKDAEDDKESIEILETAVKSALKIEE